MSGQDTHRVERKIEQARLALGWERLWAALHWPMVAFTLAAALLVSGVLAQLPFELRFGALALMAAGLVLSLRPLFRLVWPRRDDAMRRVETASGLAHRPVSGHFDRLSASQEDPATAALWDEHRRRQLAALAHVKAGRPRSFWRDIDPRALRLPAMLALGLGLILGPNDPAANFRDTLRMAPGAAENPLSLDAWLKPPAYTGKPPLLLTSPAMQQRLADGSDILTPENAVLAIRLNGAAKPGMAFYELGADNDAGAPLTSLSVDEKSRNGLYEAEVKLTRPTVVAVMDGSREIERWPIALIPDTPPSVSIEGQPGPDASGALGVAWKAADDYGVSGISADVSLSDEQEDGHGIAGNGVFLFDPPAFPIGLRHGQPRAEEGQTVHDLTAHPWAGLMVDLTLEARDAAGHATQSAPRTLKLPERVFIKPLARALVEQRRSLVMSPEQAEQAARLIEGLLLYPDGLIDRSGIHLAMATAVSRLANLRSHDDLKSVVDLLWQTALAIEEGDLADARAELEALREELRRALAEGAPPERIAELMSRLREAMDRYMQSLMEETERRMQQGGADQQQMPQQQGRMVRPEDLQKMLDMIEKLAQSGAKEAAEELLSQLEDILRNLQPGMPQQAQPQRDTPLSRMLDQLSELMRRQQGLMDDTQRLPQPGEGELSPQDGREPGANGQRGTPEGLAEDQQRLEDMLEQMLNQLGQNGLQAPPSLGEAGKEMNGATNSLRESDRDQALGQQGRALEQLRQGAENMAQQLLQQGTGNQGNYGRHGEARGDDRDPLGRPLPNRAEDFGPERNMLPSELAIRRAREILDFLRSRANEPEIPRIERDYIDRLLRGLY